jgi:hypothetical protein
MPDGPVRLHPGMVVNLPLAGGVLGLRTFLRYSHVTQVIE